MYRIIENELLGQYTSYAIGGPARWFVRVTDVSDLPAICDWMREKRVPWYVLGGGSNTLVSDAGFEGCVLKIDDRSIAIDDERMTATAGARTAMAVHACVLKGLTGFEWAFGIPGTIGGAVRGNAGAFGGSVADILESADVIDPATGVVERMTNADFQFRYRWSALAEKRRIVMRATFRLTQRTPEQCKAIVDAHLTSKKETQPLGAKCAGSTFKNNISEQGKVYVAKLLDQAGLKGAECGDAQISAKHANFIINRGAARSSDVEALIVRAKQSVKEKFGIELEEEIRYLGNDKTTY